MSISLLFLVFLFLNVFEELRITNHSFLTLSTAQNNLVLSESSSENLSSEIKRLLGIDSEDIKEDKMLTCEYLENLHGIFVDLFNEFLEGLEYFFDSMLPEECLKNVRLLSDICNAKKNARNKGCKLAKKVSKKVLMADDNYSKISSSVESLSSELTSLDAELVQIKVNCMDFITLNSEYLGRLISVMESTSKTISTLINFSDHVSSVKRVYCEEHFIENFISKLGSFRRSVSFGKNTVYEIPGRNTKSKKTPRRGYMNPTLASESKKRSKKKTFVPGLGEYKPDWR